MSIQQKIREKQKAREKLEAHCLCLKIEGDICFLPQGYSVDAVRFEESAKGMIRAERKLEEIWQESLFWIG